MVCTQRTGKTVKDEEYSRFEITFMLLINRACSKLFLDRPRAAFFFRVGSRHCILQLLKCQRKRFTSKGGTVKAKEFYVNVKVKENDKDVTRSAKAGYIFRNGETISNNIIVLVCKRRTAQSTVHDKFIKRIVNKQPQSYLFPHSHF